MSGENGGRPLPAPGTPPDEAAVTGVLADYLAGLLEGTPEGDEVADRIAAEPAWAAAYADLRTADTAVTASLRDYLATDDALSEQSMPSDVAARLDAAVADAGNDAHSADVIGLDGARKRRRTPRWVSAGGAVAAGVVVLAAAALGAGTLMSSQQNAPNSAADAPAGSPAPREGDARASGKGPQTTFDDGGPTLIASGTEYTSETVGSVTDKVDSRGVQQAPGDQSTAEQPGRLPDPAKVPAELSRFASSPTDLDACLSAIRGTALGVDYAKYNGRPALVVVVADDGITPSRIVVAGPDCGQSGADELHTEVIE